MQGKTMIGRGRKGKVCPSRCVETVDLRVLLISQLKLCESTPTTISDQPKAIDGTRVDSPTHVSVRTGCETPPLDPIEFLRSLSIRPIPLTSDR